MQLYYSRTKHFLRSWETDQAVRTTSDPANPAPTFLPQERRSQTFWSREIWLPRKNASESQHRSGEAVGFTVRSPSASVCPQGANSGTGNRHPGRRKHTERIAPASAASASANQAGLRGQGLALSAGLLPGAGGTPRCSPMRRLERSWEPSWCPVADTVLLPCQSPQVPHLKAAVCCHGFHDPARWGFVLEVWRAATEAVSASLYGPSVPQSCPFSCCPWAVPQFTRHCTRCSRGHPEDSGWALPTFPCKSTIHPLGPGPSPCMGNLHGVQ